MNLRRIELHNFLSHKDTTLELWNRNPVIVVGENGAGKSSLVKDSVTWALFGKARGNGDDLVTEGETVGLVRVEFSVGDDAYRVERVRERGKKTILNFSMTSGDNGAVRSDDPAILNGATIAETQGKIEKLLGMSYETFICTSCIEQGKADAFSSLTPKEAKQVLMRVLQLGEYETFADAARKESLVLKRQIESEDAQRKAFESDLEVLESADSRLATMKAEMAAATKERDSVAEAIVTAQAAAGEEKAELDKLKIEQEKTKVHKAHVEEAVRKLSLRLAQLSGTTGDCPLCGLNMTTEHLTRVREQLTEELATHKAEVDRLYKVANATFASIEGRMMQFITLSDDEKRLRVYLSIAETKLKKLWESLPSVTAEAEKLTWLREKVAEAERVSAGLRVSLLRYSVLEEAFGKNGIPALVIENVIPEIETTASQVLNLLTDGKMGLRLRTQKELKAGGMGDTLDIEIYYLTTSRSYGMISGGEKFRVDLSLRVALSSVLARRNSYRVESLIVDEGFGSLDAIGRTKFVELADMLKNQFKRIVIITHTDIADMYKPGELITVRKENGYSKITV